MYGVRWVDFSGINPELQKTGIDRLNADMIAPGVGVSFNIHRLNAGVEATYLFGTQSNRINNTGGTARLYLGYDLVRTGRWDIAPEIGIAWQNINVDITRLSQASDFYDALLHQLNKVQVQHNNTMLTPALTFKYRPLMSLAGTVGIRLGLKLSYDYGLRDKPWQVQNSDVSDGPRDRLSSFNATVMISFCRMPKH